MQLADRLNDLAASGHEISFGSIGLPPAVVLAEVADVAAGPQAPLLAEAVTHVFDHGEQGWAEAAAHFPIGFARQPSLLHTTAALEQLFNSTAAIQVLAKPLNGALLAGLGSLVNSRPMVAAARLEEAVRLAVSDVVSPIKVWGAIEDLDDSDTPEDFAERLPRIVGLGLDRWSKDGQAITETLRSLLRRLAEGAAGDVDAFVELGYDRLRSALTSRTVADVSQALPSWSRSSKGSELRFRRWA
ncbi:hypothetical protein [Streptomyces halstedii]|uniref:Uncharacterized protein n=1 Tax=Streptomyces halstedii TaxID=1944 RepID=A0A6N9U851_STRHA|nr:hypothetical protein [Streptomyces halstedii]NEA18752.1 hypothetical protein [Streptomyces halstedii]